MKAIVAVYHEHGDENWGIGKDGTQPIALHVDRNFFRTTTKGHTVIVGYKTMLDFPNQRPLPNRRNIVLTRQDIQIDGAEVVHSIEELDKDDLQDAFVIGGASLYHQLIDYCDELYITHIYKDISADVYFPKLKNLQNWKVETIAHGYEDCIEFKIEKLIRKKE